MKSKKMVKLLKGIGVGILTLTMMFGMTRGVNASELGEVTGSESAGQDVDALVTITKELEIANGVISPLREYEFTFTLVDVDGQTALGAIYDDVDGMQYSTTGMTGEVSTTGSIIEEVSVLDDNLQFPHAGIYIYEVVEAGTDIEEQGLTYSPAKYKVRVYVKNDTAGTGTYIHAVTVVPMVDNDGEDIVDTDSNKVDPTPNQNEGNDFRFINRYTKNTSLKISKTVTGDYGNLTKQFTFPMTMTAASTVDAQAPEYTGLVYHISNPATSVRDYKIKADGATSTLIKLAHGEYIVFDALPAGTVYTLTENGETGYTASLSLTENGVGIPQPTPASGANLVAVGNGNPDNITAEILAGENNNTAEFTNAYTTPSITGILINNLPYIVLFIVAIAGFVLFVAGKRRRANR